MFFVQKIFFLELWNENQLVNSKIVEDGSKSLLVSIDDLLGESKISMSHVNRFLTTNGPGSFSSIRIAHSTVCALQRIFHNVLFKTYYFHELLCDSKILIRLNKNIFLVHQSEWKVVFKKEIKKSNSYSVFCPEYCMHIFQDLIDEQYDLEFIQNAGSQMNQKDLNMQMSKIKSGQNGRLSNNDVGEKMNCQIKKPLYIYMPVVK